MLTATRDLAAYRRATWRARREGRRLNLRTWSAWWRRRQPLSPVAAEAAHRAALAGQPHCPALAAAWRRSVVAALMVPA